MHAVDHIVRESVVSGHDPNAFAHFQLNSGGNTGIYADVGFIPTPIIPVMPTDEWRHVVITSRSGESKIYVDGQQLGSTVGSDYSNIAASKADEPMMIATVCSPNPA